MNSHSEHSLLIDPFLRDGFEVHSGALACGFNVTLLPRQSLLVSTGPSIVGDGSFVHGVPQASTVAAVTLAQDKRIRRALLQRRGLKVPQGATFSIGRGARSARAYARRIGYPVVVKPAMGDNTIGVMAGIRDEAALNQAIEYLHTPVEERSDYTRSSYAMTELRLPGERDGRATAPPSYKFLLEGHLSGDYIRLLVLDGAVLNAMYCPNGPWRSSAEELEDVTDRVHSTIGEIAVRASKAIPGLALVAVDLIVPSMTQAVTAEEARVVEFSERPWLATQFEFDEALGIEVAMAILRFGLKARSLPAPAREVSVRVRIDGAIDPESFRVACATEAERLGLQSDLAVTDPVLGHVSGKLKGSPRLIAWLMEIALDRGISRQRAMLAEMTVETFR